MAGAPDCSAMRPMVDRPAKTGPTMNPISHILTRIDAALIRRFDDLSRALQTRGGIHYTALYVGGTLLVATLMLSTVYIGRLGPALRYTLAAFYATGSLLMFFRTLRPTLDARGNWERRERQVYTVTALKRRYTERAARLVLVIVSAALLAYDIAIWAADLRLGMPVDPVDLARDIYAYAFSVPLLLAWEYSLCAIPAQGPTERKPSTERTTDKTVSRA